MTFIPRRCKSKISSEVVILEAAINRLVNMNSRERTASITSVEFTPGFRAFSLQTTILLFNLILFYFCRLILVFSTSVRFYRSNSFVYFFNAFDPSSRPQTKQVGLRHAVSAYMPTLPDYPGVSRIRQQSPGLPYGSPNLPDKIEL